MLRIVNLFCLIIFVSFSSQAFSVLNIKLNALSILPSESGELSLTLSNNTNLAGLQFQVTYDPSQVSVGTPINGTDLTSSHMLTSNILASNSINILVYPDPTNLLVPNGQIVKLPVTLLDGASAGNKIITVQQTELTSAIATDVIPERITNGILVDPNNTTGDSDNDGIPDLIEVANNLHPLDERDALLDPDSDGLTNLAEYQAGTAMNNPDTDGDGYTDGAEILAGTNPLMPDAPTYADNNGDFDWVQTIGMAWGNASYADIVNSIYVDPNNATLRAGAFRYTLDFDPSANEDLQTSGVYNDAYITKVNTDGSYAWTWRTTGYYGAYATNVVTDAQNNIHVVGYFSGLTDFNPDPNITVNKSSLSGWDMFYAKLDANGNLLSVFTYYYWGNGYEYAKDIGIDSQGSIYITGDFQGYSMDFDPTTGSDYQDRLSYPTGFISKLNVDGSYAWTQRLGASGGPVIVNDLVIDANDNIYVGGIFYGTANFDANDRDSNGDLKSKTSNGDSDLFVVQLSSSGITNWVWKAGDTGYDKFLSMDVNSAGIVVISNVMGFVNFNEAGTGDVQGTTSFTIAKSSINSNGSYNNTKILFLAHSIEAHVAVNQLGNIFIAGNYWSSTDFDPDPQVNNMIASAGGNDIFIMKYDANGSYLWTKTIGAVRSEMVKDLKFNSLGDLYITGVFDTYQSTVDFDPGPGVVEKSSNGYEDIFLLKLKAAQ